MRAWLCLPALTICLLGCAADQAVPVKNASFEQVTPDGLPIGWSGDPAVYQVDDHVAHTGKRSLRFVNMDPGRYVLCSQPVPLKPGRIYDFSVWVKTKGLKGPDSGATICLEWTAADGKYLGGSYPAGVKGDTDWTLVHAISGRVPAKAASCTVTVYCRQHMTGTAWFDDVSIKRAFADPLASVMTVPNYRGRLPSSGPATVSFRTWLFLADLGKKPSALAVDLSVVDAKSRIVASRTLPAVDQGTVSLTLPATLPAGHYEARLALVDKATGAVLAKEHDRLVKLPASFHPVSYIDAHNRLIVDGKPFFPLGCYWSSGAFHEAQVKVFADSPFNCVMPYGGLSLAQMDLAQKYGLKVLYSIKDAYAGTTWCPADIKTPADERPWIENVVKQFRNHPALLGWYLNDELPLSMLSRLEAHQSWLEQLDPNHPTWVVLYEVNEVRQYIHTFDAIGTDPYPIPKAPSMAGAWAKTTREQVAGARPVWMVPQIMSWKAYHPKGNGRTPTYDEMRSMAWQCICEGATGLVFYSYSDLRKDPQTPFDVQWGRVKRVAAEVKKWSPVLLSTGKPVAVSVEGTDLHWIAKGSGGKTYLFIVSDGYLDHDATIRVPAGISIRRLSDGAVLTPNAHHRLTETIPPLSLIVYRLS